MNFQVTVLKVLVSYPDGFAVMADLKRDMAILATSGPDWAERTKRLAARVPDLDIFSQGLIERMKGGWRVTDKGRAVLAVMEPQGVAPRVALTCHGRPRVSMPGGCTGVNQQLRGRLRADPLIGRNDREGRPFGPMEESLTQAIRAHGTLGLTRYSRARRKEAFSFSLSRSHPLPRA
ncbi:hypothetical protein ACVWXP_007298 [Bradyrhizobium sp. USDA 4463]